MVLSVYQINNVLRVYKDQLRQNRIVTKSTDENKPLPDKISISAGAKRKVFVDKIAADIVNRITHYGPQDNIEREVFKKLEDEYGAQLDVSQKGAKDLLFKVIDDKGETINSLSIEDSDFLAHKLRKLAVETVDRIEKNKLGEL